MDLRGNRNLTCVSRPAAAATATSTQSSVLCDGVAVDADVPRCGSLMTARALCSLAESTSISSTWQEWACLQISAVYFPSSPPCGIRNASTGSDVTGVWRGVVCNDANELVKLDLSPLGRRLSGGER